MTRELLLGYAAFWVVLFRALLVGARIIPASCARCGLLFERRELGQQICACRS
jgi:hypothetical protein